MSKSKKAPTIGQLVNKLEKAIALANMRGDKAASEQFQRFLESALNGTQMKEVIL